jgi:hypothetical protein
MKFGDVEGLEIVVRRFNFGAFDDGEADGDEDVFDLLEDLADEVVRADGALDTGEREIDVFVGEGCLVGFSFKSLSLLLEFSLYMRFEFIELFSDYAL